jgi:hypothetical protein
MTVTEKVLEVKNFLHQTPIFENIIDEQLQAVANIAILQTYKKNETLVWQGDAEGAEKKGLISLRLCVISGLR